MRIAKIGTGHISQIYCENLTNVHENAEIIACADVNRCAPQATDFILEQASFQEGIPQSLQRNAEFLKTL